MDNNTESQAAHALLQVLRQAHLVNQALTRVARRTSGLRFEQLSLLCALNDAGGVGTVGMVARASSRASHTVTALADRLEALGCIQRDTTLRTDRRQVWLRLTLKGDRAVAEFQEAVQQILADHGLAPHLPSLLPSLQAASIALASGANRQAPTPVAPAQPSVPTR